MVAVIPSNNGDPTYHGAKFGLNAMPVLLCAVDPITGNPYPLQLGSAALGNLAVSGGAAQSPTTAAAGQFVTSAASAPVTGLGSDSTRKGVTLKNIDPTNTIYVSSTSPATTANSFPLAPGEFLNSQSTTALYAIAGAGTPILAWFADKV